MRRKCSISTLDTTVSKLIRERADWRCEYKGCEYCENRDFRNYPGGLHNSHYRGRRGRSTRWHPDNLFALCNKRHERMHDSPDEHTQWVMSQLGESRFDDLVLRANTVYKYSQFDRYDMNAHYRSQLEYLKRRRMNGDLGYIDIVSWD